MRAPRREAPVTARLQRAFLDDLTGRRPRSDADRDAAFRRPRRGTVADRWHVYAHGYTARIVEALEQECAAVRRILGPESFTALVERYVAVFPPRSFDLANVGDRLARFLEFDPLSQELPFLADLARLERAVAEAFVDADAAPLRWEGLRALSPEDAASLRLGLAPGVLLLRSAWPLADLWRARLEEDDEAIAITVEGRPTRALVHRRGGRVRVEELSEAEAGLVEAAGPGDVTLVDLQTLSGTSADADGMARLLSGFQALVEREVFVHKRSTGWTGALEKLKEELS
jgi:hypothetical protein